MNQNTQTGFIAPPAGLQYKANVLNVYAHVLKLQSYSTFKCEPADASCLTHNCIIRPEPVFPVMLQSSSRNVGLCEFMSVYWNWPEVSKSGSQPLQQPAPSLCLGVFLVFSHSCFAGSSHCLWSPSCPDSSPAGISARESFFYLSNHFCIFWLSH